MTKFWEERRDPGVHKDGRSAYERDYARVVHSSAFRRLQAKTQVLGLGDSDFYRTRLTHSLEVSQIGEEIARRLYRKAHKGEVSYEILPHPTLIRTVCLAHDLGHPPFGHGGEIALNRCMMDHGGFEGNAHTLRIVAKYEPYHPHFGMNLTRRAVLGVLKYPAPYSKLANQDFYPAAGHDSGSVFKADNYKPPKCYFDADQDVIEWLVVDEIADDWDKVSTDFKEKTGEHRKTKHKSLDCSIMNLADDIAYGVHDLEDSLSLHLISKRLFTDHLSEEKFRPYIEAHSGLTYDRIVDDLFSDQTTDRKKRIGHLVGYCVTNVRLASNFDEFSHPIFAFQAELTEGAEAVLGALQDFVYFDVIKSTGVQHLEFKGQKIVTELFEAFATDPKRLLTSRDWEKSEPGGGDQPIETVICNYIAGMTDEYATKRYQQLFVPRVGSVFDRL